MTIQKACLLTLVSWDVSSKKLYTHHNYQDELLQVMANQFLRKKITKIQKSYFYSIMCDEYTEIIQIKNNEFLE